MIEFSYAEAATCSPRTAFILKAMNQAVSRLYVQEDTEGQAA